MRIEGRNLEDILYRIGEGTIPWIWEQPRGFNARNDARPDIARFTIAQMVR